MTVPDTWRVSSPMLSGSAVREHQVAVNLVFHRFGFPWLIVEEDGFYGPDARRGSRQSAYMVGALSAELQRLQADALSQRTRRLISGRRQPTLFERAAARRRLPALERRRKNHRLGAATAIAWALQQAGITEHPSGTNRGPQVDVWEREFGMLGQPWCGAFTGWSARKIAGVSGIANHIVYTPATLNDARNGVNGFVALVPWSRAEPGDHVLYYFGGRDPVTHTGIVVKRLASGLHTVEGNTSFQGDKGSQSNGGCVAERTDRPMSTVVGCGRPRYG